MARKRGWTSTYARSLRVVAMFLAVLPFVFVVQDAWASPGGLDDNGCHTCHTNCEQYGIADETYHCHGAPAPPAPPATEAPIATSPPATSPPATSPPTTKPPPSATKPPPTATTSTTIAVDVAAPEPASITVAPPEPGGQETVVEITGEPGARFEVTVTSRAQTQRGVLDDDGHARVTFLVANGDHIATVVLTDGEGNVSAETTHEFDVSLPRPRRPSARVTSGKGDSPVVVQITQGPPRGKVTVRSDGGPSATDDLDDTGEATISLELDEGDHTILVSAQDFQGQAADVVRISDVNVGTDEDEAGSAVGGIILLAAVGGSALWLRRRRRTLRVQARRPLTGPSPADPAG